MTATAPPPSRTAEGAAPASTYIICCLPRSGSWLLSAGLEATGVAGRPQEYLRPELRGHYATRFGIDRTADTRAFLDAAMRDSVTANGVAGLKVHWQDMARALARLRAEGVEGTDPEVLAAAVPSPRYVHLVRRDVLRQAVSWCRALDSDTWWVIGDGERPQGPASWDPDWDKIEVLERLLVQQEAAWGRFFAAGGISPLEVVYEDFVDAREETIGRVLDHLAIAPPPDLRIDPPALRRQADTLTDRWVAGVTHLRATAAPPSVAQPLPAPPSLGSLLAGRRWIHRDDPFPHVVAHDVFHPAFHAELEAALAGLLAGGLDAGPLGFSRNIPGYDAFGHNFAEGLRWPFSLFVSRAWHDLICGVTGIQGSGHLFCGLHHHLPGSGSGSVHNDLNPGWFPAPAVPGEVVLGSPDRVTYATGEAIDPTATPVEAVRGVALLYFLGNGLWQSGDGGELGLYRSAADPVDRPAAAIPPIDNSLVLFECTPHSFHGFISNRRRPRSSLIMWVHRARAQVEAKWGPGAIVDWPRARARPAGGPPSSR